MDKKYFEKIIPENEKNFFGLNEEEKSPSKEEPDVSEIAYGGKVRTHSRKKLVVEFDDEPPSEMEPAERERFLRQVAQGVRTALEIKESKKEKKEDK